MQARPTVSEVREVREAQGQIFLRVPLLVPLPPESTLQELEQVLRDSEILPLSSMKPTFLNFKGDPIQDTDVSLEEAGLDNCAFAVNPTTEERKQLLDAVSSVTDFLKSHCNIPVKSVQTKYEVESFTSQVVTGVNYSVNISVESFHEYFKGDRKLPQRVYFRDVGLKLKGSVRLEYTCGQS